MSAVALPTHLELDRPEQLLRWLADRPHTLDLSRLQAVEIWALTALAALGRLQQDGETYLQTEDGGTGKVAGFARAVGFREAVEGRNPTSPGEPGKTVSLRRVTAFPVESIAREIVSLLVSEETHEDISHTLRYVIIELLRNVLQHSHDRLGGVIAAQRHEGGRSSQRPVVQIAVADAGIGIPAALRSKHPKLEDPAEALDKALWPHISGTFEEGLTGSAENAGMGLFFISEMAKLTAGRFLIATRGASMILEGDPSGYERHLIRPIDPQGTGYPGTLVAFEIAVDEVKDYAALIEAIRERAVARTPQRAINRWIRFDPAPQDVQRVFVRVAGEDTAKAATFAQEHLERKILAREPILLDFQGMKMCTQSYLHALLYEPVRLAWAKRVPIYVANVAPSVKSSLDLLQGYALGG